MSHALSVQPAEKRVRRRKVEKDPGKMRTKPPQKPG